MARRFHFTVKVAGPVTIQVTGAAILALVLGAAVLYLVLRGA
ncbi:hypothetical protein [Amycolatopsis circi]|nr:hypothetical protein [Amycolatopsis circi]